MMQMGNVIRPDSNEYDTGSANAESLVVRQFEFGRIFRTR